MYKELAVLKFVQCQRTMKKEKNILEGPEVGTIKER